MNDIECADLRAAFLIASEIAGEFDALHSITVQSGKAPVYHDGKALLVGDPTVVQLHGGVDNADRRCLRTLALRWETVVNFGPMYGPAERRQRNVWVEHEGIRIQVFEQAAQPVPFDWCEARMIAKY